MQDWFTPLIGFVGMIIGILITEIRQFFERKEQYRMISFEKRLEAHQAAYCLCHKLNKVLNQRNPDEIVKVSDELKEWWDNTCLLLDTRSRELLFQLTNYAYNYANGIRLQDKDSPQALRGENVWQYLSDSMKAIMQGIGSKHLPETISIFANKQNKVKPLSSGIQKVC